MYFFTPRSDGVAESVVAFFVVGGWAAGVPLLG
jgi:hypothetical protein